MSFVCSLSTDLVAFGGSAAPDFGALDVLARMEEILHQKMGYAGLSHYSEGFFSILLVMHDFPTIHFVAV